MSMLDKLFKKDTEQENIGKVTTEKAVDLIKTLSGGEAKYSKKVIDNVIVLSVQWKKKSKF